MKYAILNGPNLNLLGTREPEIYGRDSLREIEEKIRDVVCNEGVELLFMQSNHEGDLIDYVQRAEHEWGCSAVVLNPGALAHYSYALRDAVEAISIPVVEVHLTNTTARESFRHHSVTAGAAHGKIEGLGWRGYVAAVQFLNGIVE